MATRQRPTDVVIIGLGATGGIAALPLTRAGLNVVGLEAGRWHSPSDFAPDETPEQLQGLAAGGAEGEPRDPHPSAQRVVADVDAAGDPSHDERSGWDHVALLGSELAAERLGLQSRERDDPPVRRVANSQRINDRRLAAGSRGARAVLRRGRVRDRRVGQGRQHRRRHRSRRQHLRGAAPPRVPDASLAEHWLHRHDGRRGAQGRMARLSRAGRDQLGGLSESRRLHVPRVLQPRRLSPEREELHGRHDDSEGAGDGPARGRHRGDGHLDQRRCERPCHRRHVHQGRPRGDPACVRGASRRIRVRERSPAAPVQIARVPERPVEQSRSGGPALFQPQPGRWCARLVPATT